MTGVKRMGGVLRKGSRRAPGRMNCARMPGSGQMVVELAVVLPVVIVVALVAYNALRFSAACARFDRVALDCVISQGVSPPGTDASSSSAALVEGAIRAAMGDGEIFVISVSEQAGLLPHLTRFSCELSMRPWPSQLVIAGVRLGAPALLRHERSLTVDRYRPGVVLEGGG